MPEVSGLLDVPEAGGLPEVLLSGILELEPELPGVLGLESGVPGAVLPGVPASPFLGKLLLAASLPELP